MKTITIKHFCRLPVLLVVIFSIAFPISFLLFFVGILYSNIDLSMLGLIPILVSILGLGFYINYGIKISPKYVTIIYFNVFKIFNYEDIEYIDIHFDNESIWGEIKAKKQKLYSFYFDSFELDPLSPLSNLLTVKVNIKDDYIEKSIKKLSLCDKIRAHNHSQ